MGWLAILLPVLTTVGYWVFGAQRGGFLGSISESYYTLMRDVFVGTLCIEAFFLYAYRGYNAFEDRFFNGLAFLSVVIALFSMNSKPVVAGGVDAPPSCHYSITMDPTCLIVLNDRVLMSHHEAFGWIHIIAAAILFASLGYVSICLFTKTDCTEPGPEKRRRNTIYRASGIAILVSSRALWAVLGGAEPRLRRLVGPHARRLASPLRRRDRVPVRLWVLLVGQGGRRIRAVRFAGAGQVFPPPGEPARERTATTASRRTARQSSRAARSERPRCPWRCTRCRAVLRSRA